MVIARGTLSSAPSPQLRAMGANPSTVVAVVIKIGRILTAQEFFTAVNLSWPVRRS